MAEVQRTVSQGPITPILSNTGQRYLSASSRGPQLHTTTSRPLSNVGPLSPVNENGSFAFDRVIKSGKVDRRVKKKGAWKSSWKPAYLVMRPNLLSVYRDQDETELRASITLSDVTAVAPVKKTRHEHVFGVFSPVKNYHFAASSAREASEWITYIRLEARTEQQDDLRPPNASFKQGDGPGYDTTDLSADDDPDLPGSPEAPQWSVRGQKSRGISQSKLEKRNTSNIAAYSGNESFATSQSDFSDGLSSSVSGPKGYLSASMPAQSSMLDTIPDDAPAKSRPAVNRSTSYLSDIANPPQSATNTTKALPIQTSTSTSTTKAQPQPSDPSRVIRQGHLKLSKTISGVKQWKSIWMVLRPQSLTVYKSANEYTPLFLIPTHSIIEAAEIDRKNKQNCFQVIGEEKTYRLQADSEDELESWLGALKSVLVKLEGERGSRQASVSGLDGGGSAGTSTGTNRLVVQQQPASREGERMGGIATQMRGVSLEQGSGQGTRRVINPPSNGLATSAHAQVTN